MHLILKQDLRKLMADTEETKFALERLEKDHAIWARNNEEKDIEQFINRVKLLESDISLLMSNCFCLSREFDRKRMEDFHQAYVHMNALFQDLKKARKDLNRAYLSPEELGELTIDWGRFKKSIERIKRHLRDGKPLQS